VIRLAGGGTPSGLFHVIKHTPQHKISQQGDMYSPFKKSQHIKTYMNFCKFCPRGALVGRRRYILGLLRVLEWPAPEE
jgi:hypothetical protein